MDRITAGACIGCDDAWRGAGESLTVAAWQHDAGDVRETFALLCLSCIAQVNLNVRDGIWHSCRIPDSGTVTAGDIVRTLSVDIV